MACLLLSLSMYFLSLRNIESFFAFVIFPMQLAVIFSFGVAVFSLSRLDDPSREVAQSVLPNETRPIIIWAFAKFIQIVVLWLLLLTMLPFSPLLASLPNREAGPEVFYIAWVVFSGMAAAYFLLILPAFWRVHGKYAS
ncbi:hypothetical protein [Salinisphaera aquimarina]|uniref:Uncharacterized protein n=1 Tax=Salinisphaera aquimarina TaxID=2094031 RepID=A0ABV7EWT9_9GAMM